MKSFTELNTQDLDHGFGSSSANALDHLDHIDFDSFSQYAFDSVKMNNLHNPLSHHASAAPPTMHFGQPTATSFATAPHFAQSFFPSIQYPIQPSYSFTTGALSNPQLFAPRPTQVAASAEANRILDLLVDEEAYAQAPPPPPSSGYYGNGMDGPMLTMPMGMGFNMQHTPLASPMSANSKSPKGAKVVKRRSSAKSTASSCRSSMDEDDPTATPNPAKPKRSRIQTSIYRGVSRCTKDGRWQARIRVKTGVTYLGRFAKEEDAARRYDEAARIHHGAQAVLNFLTPGDIERGLKSVFDTPHHHHHHQAASSQSTPKTSPAASPTISPITAAEPASYAVSEPLSELGLVSSEA